MQITITAPDLLNDPTFIAVSALVQRCNRAERLDLPITVEVHPLQHLLLVHLDGELAGVATVSYAATAEICLCVDPACRRLGIGRRLALNAQRHAMARNPTPPLFVSDLAAASGRAFASALGFQQRFAEHRMNLDLNAVPSLPAPLPGLAIRPAQTTDARAMIAILAAAFNDPPAMVERFVTERLALPHHRFLIATIETQPVGILRLVREDGWIYITTFGVLPTRHGQGIGRFMLLYTIELLRNCGEGAIRIEVETENKAAYGLYRACGFCRTHTFTYEFIPA